MGRDREFTQCDVDVVGVEGQLIEAELMTLFVKAFKELDIAIVIKYNSRNLMNGLILESGVNEDLISLVTTNIDKLEKISKDEFKSNLLNIGLTLEQIEKILEYFSLSLCELNKLFKNTENEKIVLGLDELNQLTNYLEKLNISDLCMFAPTLARGQNYYTGNVFEVYEKNGKITCSIGAGGRYDKMITNFIGDGNVYPTVGISFGLSSIYELLKDRELFLNKSDIDIYIIPMGTNIESLKLANELRDLGYKVEIQMQNKKLKKSLDYANRERIPYVIILGEDELKRGSFNLKDMVNNKKIEINLNDLEKIKTDLMKR